MAAAAPKMLPTDRRPVAIPSDIRLRRLFRTPPDCLSFRASFSVLAPLFPDFILPRPPQGERRVAPGVGVWGPCPGGYGGSAPVGLAPCRSFLGACRRRQPRRAAPQRWASTAGLAPCGGVFSISPGASTAGPPLWGRFFRLPGGLPQPVWPPAGAFFHPAGAFFHPRGAAKAAPHVEIFRPLYMTERRNAFSESIFFVQSVFSRVNITVVSANSG